MSRTEKNVWILVFGLMLGFVIGCVVIKNAWDHNAVQAGKAEYYLDKNNQRQWRWKP